MGMVNDDMRAPLVCKNYYCLECLLHTLPSSTEIYYMSQPRNAFCKTTDRAIQLSNTEETGTLTHTLTRIDYCNSIFYGFSECTLTRAIYNWKAMIIVLLYSSFSYSAESALASCSRTRLLQTGTHQTHSMYTYGTMV